jgi:hypothetical protein
MNIKAAAMDDAIRLEMERLGPAATPLDKARSLARIQDDIDFRYGQMVWDNRFWDKRLVDTLNLLVSAPGWQIGDIGAIGGGAADTATMFTKARRGNRVTQRMAWAAALPITVALHGAVYQYLMTGKPPEDAKDLFYPRNGNTRPDGKPERVFFASIMRDVLNMPRHPIQSISYKLSPLLRSMGEVSANKDFNGVRIFGPDASKWPLEALKYVVHQHTPISVSQEQRLKAEGVSGPKRALAFMGVGPAPAEVYRSKAENRMAELMPPQAAVSPEQYEAAQGKRELVGKMRRGEATPAEVRDYVEANGLSRAQGKNIQRAGKESVGLTHFRAVKSIDDAFEVWAKATPAEKAEWRQVMRSKVAGYIRGHTGKAKADMIAQAQKTGVYDVPR